MMTLTQMAASLTAVGVIGAGALTLDTRHVAASDFEKYIEVQQAADDRDYVLKLKQSIRNIKEGLANDPSQDYLVDALADAIDSLCEMRPEDRLCDE